jgi:hypothetical protein
LATRASGVFYSTGVSATSAFFNNIQNGHAYDALAERQSKWFENAVVKPPVMALTIV